MRLFYNYLMNPSESPHGKGRRRLSIHFTPLASVPSDPVFFFFFLSFFSWLFHIHVTYT